MRRRLLRSVLFRMCVSFFVTAARNYGPECIVAVGITRWTRAAKERGEICVCVSGNTFLRENFLKVPTLSLSLSE